MDITAECVCAKLRKASRLATRIYDQALAPAGLKVTQYSLLRNIQKLYRQGATAAKLSQVLRMDKTTLARNLDLLEREGLIETLPGPDRRTKLIQLTEPGLAKVRRAMPLWQACQQDMAARLGQNRLDRLFEDLGVLEELID